MADKEESAVFALFIKTENEGIGIGGKLLDAAGDALWAEGNSRATLSTEPDTRAFEFYKRRGWKHAGSTPDGEAVLELRKIDR